MTTAIYRIKEPDEISAETPNLNETLINWNDAIYSSSGDTIIIAERNYTTVSQVIDLDKGEISIYIR